MILIVAKNTSGCGFYTQVKYFARESTKELTLPMLRILLSKAQERKDARYEVELLPLVPVWAQCF